MAEHKLAIFTICSNNYVPMAKVLIETAAQYHPDADIYLCLADTRVDEPDFYPQGCTVVVASQLGIPDFESFSFRYDVMEFNTAVKPFMIRHLLRAGFDGVLYFDPDIEIFRPLDSIVDALRDGASFVMTPHLCQPSEGDAYPGDLGIMRAGVYNLGFLGVGAGHEADAILRWWSRRLLHLCLSDQANGIFVDQKFMDLVPGFASHVRILRDTTLNVAYWNLSQRTLTCQDGTWLVDGRPLGFFHYSGFNPSDLTLLSKHTEEWREGRIGPDLGRLMQGYAGRLLANGHGAVPAGLYAYGKFRSGTNVTAFVRQAFRINHPAWSGNPFDTFEEFLGLPTTQAWSGPAGTQVTNLMSALHKMPSIQAAFDPAKPDGSREFHDWFVRCAEPWVGDARLIEPVAERSGERAKPLRRPPAKRSASDPDVDVIGYLRLAVGVGEAGRLTLRSLAQAGLDARGLETSHNAPASRNDDSCVPLLAARGDAPVQVFGVNADQIGEVIEHFGAALRSDAYRIIMPFWELSTLPDVWVDAFDRVDEVWAPTRFIQATLMQKVRKPVIRMPLTLEFQVPATVRRSKFRLPEGKFLFFFAFDYFSYLERKNPLAVFEAFKRAFRSHGHAEPAALVLKTINADMAPEKGEALRDALRDDPDVILIERTLSREDTLALIAACDAVVSLHRSEGLGLLVAEAMVLGKPAISTDYSATTELVTPETGYPVDYRLIGVKDGEYPHAEGQHWADPDVGHAAWQMRAVFRGGAPVARRVAAAKAHITANYGHAAVSRRQLDRLRMIDAGP